MTCPNGLCKPRSAWENVMARPINTDGPGGATNSVIPALPPSDRRFHMSTPRPADSPQVAAGWQAYDLTPADVAPMLDRFIRHFSPGTPSECWMWTGPKFLATGYGKLSRSSYFERNQHLLAHRISWVAFSGQPIDGQMTVDHLCNNKLCVNPDHLELVTLHENIRRKNERLGNLTRVTGAERVPCDRCGKPTRRAYMSKHVARMHVPGAAA